METVGQRIIRHLRHPSQIDMATVLNGLRDVRAALRLSSHRHLKKLDWESIANYLEIEDLDVVTYDLHRPSHWADSEMVTFTTFPMDSRLRIHIATPYVVEEEERFPNTNLFPLSVPHAIGSFTGPTFQSLGELPNNGFFYWPEEHDAFSDTHVVFRDTSPSGQRRGAIAHTHTGETKILTDTQKWHVIRNYENSALAQKNPVLHEQHPEFEALVGTSFYFTNFDDFSDALSEQTGHRGRKSYLIKDESGQLTHAVFGASVNREEVHEVVTHWGHLRGSQDWIAAELEYSRSNTVVIPQDNDPVLLPPLGDWKRVGFERPDHYVMVREPDVKEEREV